MGPLIIIVIAPYIVLVNQWEIEMRRFGLHPIICAHSRVEWEPRLRAAVYTSNRGDRPILSLITTNATFSSEPFQDVLSTLNVRTLIIADEVHNLGARNLKESLPEQITLRLGLSATPVRFMDEDGTEAVMNYFGPVVASIGVLADAISSEPPVLCPYDYYPIIVEFNNEESEKYIEITKKLARYIRDPRTEEISPLALLLLLERSRIIANAKGKIPALILQLEPFKHSTHILVYCGDGSLEVDENIDEGTIMTRQVDEVVKTIGRDLGMSVRRYTYQDTYLERSNSLKEFRAGSVQVLVAIRCLDEGVDIPAVSKAFILASSTNPRQFIQRRGRVLRMAPGKTHADIFDFIVAPPRSNFEEGSKEFILLRGLLEKELRRVVEFLQTARNRHAARASLTSITTRLGLDHI